MPEKDRDFFASRIQTWYRRHRKAWYDTHRNPRQFYVLKEYCQSKPLSKEDIVKEHIASVIYRLLGIRTPEIRIVLNDEKEIIGIASQYIKGYKDLDKIINEHADKTVNELVDELDAAPTQEERIRLFNETFSPVPIADRELLLLASVFLQDSDIVGVNFTNIGGRWNELTQQFEWIKIDTGSLDYRSDIDRFKQDVSLRHQILSEGYTSRVYNDPDIILVGNVHLLEFFGDINQEKLIKQIESLANISDEEIKRHILRQEYASVVSQEMLNNIVDVLIQRKQHLLSLVKPPRSEAYSKKISLQPVFIERSAFSEPVHTIPRGNAKPSIVYKKEDDDVQATTYFSL